jgi:hypothetical protein
MSTTQILILSIFSILLLIAVFRPNLKLIKEGYSTDGSLVLGFLSVLFFITIAVTSVIENNKLRSTNPCPTLEKVENVYKIVP